MNAPTQQTATDGAIVSGFGHPVILLHGSAGSNRLWSGLAGAIDGRFRVIAPKMPGYERDGHPAPTTMDGIVAEIAPRLLGAGAPVHLVGHDFGAVVALECAARFPGRVASLTMIEPVAVNALWGAEHIGVPATAGFRAALAKAQACLDADDAFSAMGHLVDFWNGSGAWMSTSFRLQRKLTAMAGKVLRDIGAIAGAPVTPVELAGVACPTLLITGEASPQPMAAISAQLTREIPFARHECVPGAGHFVHLTDPHVTDPMIRAFLIEVNERRNAAAPIVLAA